MNVVVCLLLSGLMLAPVFGPTRAPMSPMAAEMPESWPGLEPAEEAVAEPAAVESTVAEPAAPAAPEMSAELPAKSNTFVVFLPERVERAWYWYLYTEEVQHLVQSAVEKALINAGLQVVSVASLSLPHDGTLNGVMTESQTLGWAREAGVAYVIMGVAAATPQSESTAYGVRVVRVSADASARIIRVGDGRVMTVQDATATAGGQAVGTAAHEALKQVGADLGRKLARAAAGLTTP